MPAIDSSEFSPALLQMREAIAAGGFVTRLEDTSPAHLLEQLDALGDSFCVEVSSESCVVTLEMGNGVVIGARGEHEQKGELEGWDAYALLRSARRGEARVAPLRFGSMANILEPISELPGLSGISSAPPPAGHDTDFVPLPAARPVHIADPTEEIELPPGALLAPPPVPETAKAASRKVIVEPEPELVSASSLEVTDGSAVLEASPSGGPARRPRTRAGALAFAAAAVVGLLFIAGGAYAGLRSEPAAEPASSSVAEPDLAPEPVAIQDEAPTEEEASATSPDRERARALAREARRLIRNGQAAEAVPVARRAASMRRHLPYYQIVVGDALRASGHPVAARRAYRRALRLRPGYAPAERRLRS